jgi:outer membrane protein assembly factor BamD
MRSNPWMRRLLSPLLALTVVGCGATTLPAIHSEPERLEVARRMHAQGEYVVAAELLKTYVANNAGSADVDHAIYLLGHCHLKTKDWTGAAAEFERLLRDYPESDSSAAARFALGEALFAQSRPPDFDQEYTIKALEEWQRYLRDFPGHGQNELAKERILVARSRLADKAVRNGVLYLKLRLTGPARVWFQKVTSEYPDTVWVAEAQMGLAICDARDGKRPEAIAQFKSIEERYAGQPIAQKAARERKRLERSS